MDLYTDNDVFNAKADIRKATCVKMYAVKITGINNIMVSLNDWISSSETL